MARPPMITRTAETTHATVLCMDIENREPCNIDLVLPRTYKDEKEMMKAVNKAITNPNIKAVQVVAHTVKETVYGMSEADFIANATVLDPKTRKPINTEN